MSRWSYRQLGCGPEMNLAMKEWFSLVLAKYLLLISAWPSSGARSIIFAFCLSYSERQIKMVRWIPVKQTRWSRAENLRLNYDQFRRWKVRIGEGCKSIQSRLLTRALCGSHDFRICPTTSIIGQGAKKIKKKRFLKQSNLNSSGLHRRLLNLHVNRKIKKHK